MSSRLKFKPRFSEYAFEVKDLINFLIDLSGYRRNFKEHIYLDIEFYTFYGYMPSIKSISHTMRFSQFLVNMQVFFLNTIGPITPW